MINLNTTAGPARSALTGSPEAAPAGDFLAVLATLVTDVTTEASPEGSGLLLPGSPLLDAASLDAASLGAEVVAELDAMLEDGLVATDGSDGDAETGIPWPTVQALAALLAQPSAPADEVPATPNAETATGAGAVEVADGSAVTPVAARPATTETREVPDDAGVDAEARVTTAPATATTAPATTEGTSAADEGAPTARATAAAVPAAATDAAPLDGEPATDAAAADEEAASPAGPAPEATRRAISAEARSNPVEATDSLTDANQPATDLRAAPVRDRGPMTSTAAGVARVLDALDRLELAPPPRQVTLEFGDMRVRVAMEDGGVRMQLLGEQRDGGREFLRAAEEALRERGFDLTGDDRGDDRDKHDGRQRPDLAPPRPERAVGRPGRSTDTNHIGVRPGVHL